MSRKRPLSRKTRKQRLQAKLMKAEQTADLSQSAVTIAIHEIVRLKQELVGHTNYSCPHIASPAGYKRQLSPIGYTGGDAMGLSTCPLVLD